MNKILKIMLLLMVFITAAGAAAFIYYQQSLEPVEPGESVIVEIPPGSSTREIANILEKNGLIRNASTFSFYVSRMGMGGSLQAGKYQFSKGQTADEIIDMMAKGDIYVETVQFTIPEGLTIPQIAELLESKGYIDKEKFLNEINTGTFDYDFVQAIPHNKQIAYRLEGYLFPKTYKIKKDANEHEIIDVMLKQFKAEFYPELYPLLKESGLSLHEAVTLASIVEREVKVDKERPKVAGVYYNRLAKGILLQADATVQYALGEQKDILTYKDLEIDSPYNTYKYKGLPPGPIAAPGLKSLEAVVKPEKHNYLFYVTKKDGTGEHYFSETYQQHLRNIALSKKEK